MLRSSVSCIASKASAPGVAVDRRQADAVDATTESPSRTPSATRAGLDPQGRAVRAVVDGGDGADLLDDAGEHDVASGRVAHPGVEKDIRADAEGLQRQAAAAPRRSMAGANAGPNSAGASGSPRIRGATNSSTRSISPSAQQRAGQRRATLAEHGLDVARGERPQAVGEARDGQRLDARRLQRRAPVGGRVGPDQRQHRALAHGCGRAATPTGSRARAGRPPRAAAGARRAARRRAPSGWGRRRAPCRCRPAPRRPRRAARARTRGSPAPEIQRASPLRGGGAPVERDRRLVGEVRPAERDGRPEAGVLTPRGEADRARRVGDLHLDARRAQPREAARRRPRRTDRCAAATTRVTPAAIRASAHGGVRPACAQGSRLT